MTNKRVFQYKYVPNSLRIPELWSGTKPLKENTNTSPVLYIGNLFIDILYSHPFFQTLTMKRFTRSRRIGSLMAPWPCRRRGNKRRFTTSNGGGANDWEPPDTQSLDVACSVWKNKTNHFILCFSKKNSLASTDSFGWCIWDIDIYNIHIWEVHANTQ